MNSLADYPSNRLVNLWARTGHYLEFITVFTYEWFVIAIASVAGVYATDIFNAIKSEVSYMWGQGYIKLIIWSMERAFIWTQLSGYRAVIDYNRWYKEATEEEFAQSYELAE